MGRRTLTGTLVRNNLSQRKGRRGIKIRAAGTRLRDDGAFDNRLLGIGAVAGPRRVLLAVGLDARLP